MASNFFDQFDTSTAKPEGGGNFFDQFDPASAKPEPEPGFAARLGQGASRALDSAKTALTDDPNKIAKIAADQARTALPQTPLQRQLTDEFKPYVDAANKAEGFVDNVTAWGAAGFKRAGQLLSNPAEAGKMLAEQLPNSLPSLAGGFAGAKGGAALGTLLAGPVGTVPGAIVGGIAGGFAGGYGLEKGAAMQEQVQQEAQKRKIDSQNQEAVAGMVAEKQPEFDATAQRKGVGTAGTDAILNVATMGLAGMGGRALAKEAQALSKAIQEGTISAADASTKIAALQAANAARNTLGAKAARGAGVVGAEMVGEGVSEAVGQKYAYGEVDAGQVIDESLMGLGTGGAMALGGKAFNKAAGIVDQDATTQTLTAAQAEIERRVEALPDAAGALAQQQAQAARDAEIAASRAAESPDDEILQSTGAALRPSEAMGLRSGPEAGSLENAAAMSVDTGATAQLQQAAAQAQAAEAAKKGKPANQKQEQPAQAQQEVDQDTGEISGMPTMSDWSDADLSTAFRNAQSKDVRLQLANELSRRRAAREEAALQAELQADQAAADMPDAPDAPDSAFARVQEDAGAVPKNIEIQGADHSRQQKIQKAIQTSALQAQPAINEGAKTDGTQTDQAQQSSTQPAQAGATQGGAQPAAGSAPGANTSGEGAGDGALRRTVGERGDVGAEPAAQGLINAAPAIDIDDAGAQWKRMSAAERSALVGRVEGVKPVLAKNMPRAEWEHLNADVQRKLQAAMAAPQQQTATKTEAASAQPVSNSIENKNESTGQKAQVATESVASQPEQVTPAATGEKLKTNIFGLPDGIDFQPGTQAARAASLKAGDWIVADGNVTRVVDAQPQASGSVRLSLQNTNGTSSSDFGPSDTVQRKLTNDGDNATAAPASVLDGILEGLDAIKTGMAKTGPVADAPAAKPASLKEGIAQARAQQPKDQPQQAQAATETVGAFKHQSEVPPTPGVYRMREGTFARFDHGFWYRAMLTAKEALLTEFSAMDEMRPANRYSPEFAWTLHAEISKRDPWGSPSAMKRPKANKPAAQSIKAQAATENLSLDVLERKTDEVMANVVEPGSINITREQVRLLIQEKGVAAADKTIAVYQDHVTKQAEIVRKYSERKEAKPTNLKEGIAAARAKRKPQDDSGDALDGVHIVERDGQRYVEFVGASEAVLKKYGAFRKALAGITEANPWLISVDAYLKNSARLKKYTLSPQQAARAEKLSRAMRGVIDAASAATIAGVNLNETPAATAQVATETVAPEIGPFGPILTQYRHDAQGAIKALTALQDGEAVAALHHPEVGDIDLVWGKAPQGKAQGLGLAKLLVKHPEVLGDLQRFLSRLKKDEKGSGPNRVRLTDGSGQAVVSLDWKGGPKRWLLTAYESGAEVGTSMDTASNDFKGDTARLEPNSAVSVVQQPAQAQAPAKRKLPPKLAAKAAEVEAQRAAYFAPGNVVASYAGHDRVVAYTPADAQGNWTVTVRPVERQGDKWVDAQNSKPRTHSTQPDARAMKAGPVVAAKANQTATPDTPAQAATNLGAKSDSVTIGEARAQAIVKEGNEARHQALRDTDLSDALNEFSNEDAKFGNRNRNRASGASQTDQAVMDMVREGKTAKDVLALIAGTSRKPFNKQLARLLLKTGINPALDMGEDMGGGDGFTFLAKYSRKNDAVTLTEGAADQAEQILLHELTHAATLKALDRKGLASIQMRHLYEHVKKQGGAVGQYGMKNVGEFVAEAFTNPEFQRALKTMKAPKQSKLATAWDSLVQILKGILGIPHDSTNALSAALEIGTAVMRENRTIKSATNNNGNFDPDDADIAHFGAADLRRLKDSAQDQLDKTLNHPGKVSLWDKTVGTMRHLAERNPAFKPVFESAQRHIDDVSTLANDAADAAPRILPRVDKFSDLKFWGADGKKPLSAADNKAIGKALFEGTLLWGRDVDGTAVLVDAMEKKYANLPANDKANMMLEAGRLDAGVLRMWRGLPLAQFESLISSRFDSKVLKAGVVWSDKELKGMMGLNDQQISLYREGRAAVDRSIDVTTRTDMLRLLGEERAGMRDMVLAQESLQDAMELLTKTLVEEAKANPDMSERLMQIHNQVVDRATQARDLMDAGYMPLSRFGQYTVDVVDAAGERQYFGMFESARDSNLMKLKMQSAFPGAKVVQGTMSQQAFKLFQGVTPESLELFGNMLGLDSQGNDAKDKAFQEYLKLAKNNHSSLKRLIHRQGIAGYSEDVGRVLAGFVYSNARQGAGALNAGTMEKAVNDIPKEQGELKDVALGLRSYISDPREEGQAVRGMLFAQYLGGSVASAFVNMTQPFAVTLPWLSQFGGMKKAGQFMADALKDMGTRGFKYEASLAHALKLAEEDGTVSPQEIHQLMAQARGSGSLRSGDGTRAGDARAGAANHWERVKVAWGQPFALAEQFNRRSTFIAAYRMAQANQHANPAEFASKAVLETQFLYSKANKMKWARGTVGGTLMTFKTYSISYLELMQRTWNAGAPGSPERAAGRRAVGWAMLMLMLMGGAGGLPFMEDLEDVIDALAQMMGYNVSSKQWRKQAMADVMGKELADFMDNGLSGLPGAPIDVSGRLGMGNLIPGTGLFQTKQSRTRDMLELVGPAGDLVARAFSGAGRALKGDVAGAALEVSPSAVRNAAKGADMAVSGIYKDTKGYKVIDTTLDEALAKFAGFQPKSVAKVQEANSFMLRSKSFYMQTSSEIRAQWADALFNKDDAALEKVRGRLDDWNRNNPDQRITIKIPDVWKKVREMGKDRTQRIADTAPKALRGQMREMVQEVR